jgi:hypothetical protein
MKTSNPPHSPVTEHLDSQRFRQIHLDFHTSEYITGIGDQFDPDEFAETLQKAQVNSINCFGRGHHGMIYYDTQKFPERRHPHLSRNLLVEQIKACHKRDIRVPIYITLQVDYFTARQHPEWRIIDPDGKPANGLIYTPSFWKLLCLNTPYTDFLKEHIAELFNLMPVDGLWLDIIEPRDCSCQYCWLDMEKKGLDPRKTSDRQRFANGMVTEFMLDMTAHIRQFDSDCTIYYNSGHIWPFHQRAAAAFTHFDLESLSSTDYWPYPYYQTTARYARILGKEIVGMTGKFHTSWGDFHSFKSQAALEFDCFQALATTAKCSIGDQLHPSGKIDPVTYELVGAVYAQVAEKEPWCVGAQAVSEIGVLTTKEYEYTKLPHHPNTLTGAVRMLLEGGHQFDVLDSFSEFGNYKLLILPDHYPLNEKVMTKLEKYLADGGKLIASFEAGLDDDLVDFGLERFGVTKVGEGPLTEDDSLARGMNSLTNAYAEYIIPTGDIGTDLHPTEYVMYACGLDVSPRPGAEVLLTNTLSYFNREYKHFCSHKQTPSSGRPGSPAVVKNENVIYFSHPIFTLYYDKAPWWCKRLFLNAIRMLIGEPIVKTKAPSTAIVTLNAQPAENRQVLHILNYIPERRGQEFDIIEDVIPLHDIAVSVRAEQPIQRVELVPQQEPLDFTLDAGRVKFTIPKVNGHQMVAIE